MKSIAAACIFLCIVLHRSNVQVTVLSTIHILYGCNYGKPHWQIYLLVKYHAYKALSWRSHISWGGHKLVNYSFNIHISLWLLGPSSIWMLIEYFYLESADLPLADKYTYECFCCSYLNTVQPVIAQYWWYNKTEHCCCPSNDGNSNITSM